MSANFYELLKYAQTGISSPDMTYYDKMRASTLMGGVVQTLTGIPPLTFKADGTPLISWNMKGNGSQSGTPTPDNPVMPEFVGVRTGNLFDISSVIYGTWINSSGVAQSYGYGARSIDIPSSQITVSFNGLAFPYSYSIVWVDNNGEFVTRSHIGSATQIREPQTFTPPSNAAKFYIQLSNGTDSTSTITEEQIESYKLMLNSGSTALPYEPYGWAEKITCAGQTTPVYLGEVPTVRRVKKYEFTGQENISQGSENFYTLLPASGVPYSDMFCTHNVYGACLVNNNGDYVWLKNSSWSDYATAADLKAFFQQEYSAGHPVTIRYVLANEQTGIVNEPLCKIGDYADELHSTDAGVSIPTDKGNNVLTVDTTLQPSEMTITFKG